MDKKDKKHIDLLRWPWNVLIYILLAITLRLFSIPIILILLAVQRKNNPHGAAEGYCLSRTHKRLVWVLWSLLLLAISAALFGCFLIGLGQDRTFWERMDYITMAVAGGGGIIMLLLGLYTGYAAIRDAFFPEKSALAKSIRGQLPNPDLAPPVEELFAMVDNDLREHGQWFGAAGIGQEWVLGDLANRIDRIRGIFTVDKVHQHQTQTGVRHNRTLELVLIDNRWQRQATTFSSPSDLRAAADYLALRVPDAVRGVNDQYMDFWQMEERDQESFEWSFQQKQKRRKASQSQLESQQMILQQINGAATTRVTPQLVEEQLRTCLSGNKGSFVLTANKPIAAGDKSICAIRCSAGQAGQVWLSAEFTAIGGHQTRSLGHMMTQPQAMAILEKWLRQQAPDITGWKSF